MANNFTIDGRLKDLPDIQRAYNFELLLPTIGGVISEDMLLRVRTATIPQRAVDAITSQFFGMKQYFPGQSNLTSTISINFEEFEDQKVLQQLTKWMDLVFSIDPDNVDGGHGQAKTKRDVTGTMELRMYAYNGDLLPVKIQFFNTWIESIQDSALAYATNDSVKIDATFRFDYWLIK